jgi:DNA-binding response OmpR family regulator
VPFPQQRTGGETILVIEDDPAVRSLVERMLTVRGYVVLPAGDAEGALRLAGENDVDAVVSDVMLPSVSGPELVERLRRHNPDLRALFTSGFSTEALLQRGIDGAEAAFVQKPFSSDELASRLRELLDS